MRTSIVNTRNISTDLEVVDCSETYSRHRVVEIIKDSLAVINTECLTLADLIAPFQDPTADPVLKAIVKPLTEIVKGFLENLRIVQLSAHNKLAHANWTSSLDSGRPSKLETSSKLTPRNGLAAQKALQQELQRLTREMADRCLAVHYTGYRKQLMVLQADYQAVARSADVSEDFAGLIKEERDAAVDFYKSVFQQEMANAIDCFIRFTFMFSHLDPAKIKQALADLPAVNPKEAIRKSLMAEIDRDAAFLQSTVFKLVSHSKALPMIAAHASHLAEAYVTWGRQVEDLAFMFVTLQAGLSNAEKSRVISSFVQAWSSGERSAYSREIERQVVEWIRQSAGI